MGALHCVPGSVHLPRSCRPLASGRQV